MLKTAYIFDVDGVITDPIQKQITKPEIISYLLKLMESGSPIALNSGRSLEWIKERVLKQFNNAVIDNSVLKNLFIVGEKGCNWMEFEGNKWNESGDTTLAIPIDLKDKLKLLAGKLRSMFFDSTKKVMATLEIKDGYNYQEFIEERNSILPSVEKILENNPNFIAQPSTIDIDIQHKASGKHLGAKRIRDWFARKNIKPIKIVMFGDSQSDVEMAEELQDNFPITFVFVNDKRELKISSLTCEVVYPEKKFTAGTLEYLKSKY